MTPRHTGLLSRLAIFFAAAVTRTYDWLRLVIIRLALRLLGYRRCFAILSRLIPPRSDASQPDIPAASALARRIDAAAANRWWTRLYRPACLERSLLLWWLLSRRHLHPTLRFGAASSGGVASAHAWVELDGVVLSDTPDVASRYAPVFPSATESAPSRARSL